MSPEERRSAIVEATLPLLAEHGMNVTTSQIAKAAGIAEGTVFRVFTDKQELIQECISAVIRPEEGLDFIRSQPKDLELRERLSRVANGMAAHLRKIGALMHALSATGYKIERLHEQKPQIDREKWLQDATEALVEVIGPDGESLRLPLHRTAQMFLGVVFSSQFTVRMRFGENQSTDEVDIDELVDVFLHGVLRTQ